MSQSLDPDQARHIVGHDLDPNCLQRLSAEDTRRQKVIKNDTFSLELSTTACVCGIRTIWWLHSKVGSQTLAGRLRFNIASSAMSREAESKTKGISEISELCLSPRAHN